MSLRVCLVAAMLFVFVGETCAQRRQEPLADQVKKSIDKGVEFLKKEQLRRNNGSWEIDIVFVDFEGAGTSMAILALLNAGVPVTDPAVQNGLRFLRGVEPTRTYVRALQTMVLAEAGQVEDLERIQKNVKWLVDARVLKNDRLVGWSYTNRVLNLEKGRPISDNSNSQYAVLGLAAGRQAGAAVSREIWEQIRDYYIRNQLADGQWDYANSGGGDPRQKNITMTSAGICGLLLASMELNVGREGLQADGTATNCGRYKEDEALTKGLGWLSNRQNFSYNLPGAVFYNIYGIERVGRFSGQRFLGHHDWYREGCKFLVDIQKLDGSWLGTGQFDTHPLISTCFALLFLSKGRTPVLISKLVHGPREKFDREKIGQVLDTDWNNDRNDLANLVRFSSQSLFKKLPLAWQNFDMTRATNNNGELTDDNLLDVTSDLLQSPILYFNGHKSPHQRFTGVEKQLLKKYIDNGGFLLVEACCNSAEFDEGFKALCGDLWKEDPLDYLDENHAIWRSFFATKPGQPYKLMGINRSCKTVVVYSPQDLSCQWENNEQKSVRGEQAFKLGANIVAYATGMEPPKPRLTQVDLARIKDEPGKVPRGFFKVGQLRHRGDWQAAPRAMPNLMDYLRTNHGLDVSLKTQDLSISADSRTVIDYKFLYMHGRSEFSFTSEQLKHLRFDLETGGLLFADSCCGTPVFDKSFRQFVKVLFPEHKLQEVPLDDALYGAEVNKGTKLDSLTIKCRRERKVVDVEDSGKMRSVPPYLEGIKIDNRWVLLYSKYDIGCALERHQSSDCLGYDHDSASKIAAAAVLYLLEMQP